MAKKAVIDAGKVPPQAVDIEEALLGSLIDYGRFDYCVKTISSKHFYKEAHQMIYEAMERLYKNKEPVDILSVKRSLGDNLEAIGGPYYLVQLVNLSDPSAYKVDYYAKIIFQKYVARELIRISSNVMNEAYDEQVDVYDLIQALFKSLQEVSHVNYINYPKILHYERIVLKNCITDNEAFLSLSGNIPDYFFVDSVHQVIWNILTMLHDTDVPVNFNSVKDVLDESQNKSHIPYLEQLLEYDFGKEEENFIYLVQHLRKNYDRIQIFKLYRYLEAARIETDPQSVVQKIETVLENIRIKDIEIKNKKALLDSTLTDIVSKHTEGNFSVIKTGYPYVDSYCKFSKRNIVLLGGARGHGKTRVAIKLVLSILQNNKDVAAFFITMEDPADKVVKLMVASMTGLEVDQIDSRGYSLSKEERDHIKKSFTEINNYDIEFIDQEVSIAHAEAAFVKFAKKRPGKTIVLLLDNIMVLTDMDGTVKTEDMIAKRFIRIVRKTNGLLFVLHHFTKEQANKSNMEEGYRPKEDHLKGSTRFLDVSHYVLLMNLVKKYSDFMLFQRKKPMISIKGVKYKREEILNELLIIEASKHRDGSNDEQERILRFYPTDLGTMQINEWR